MDQSDSLRSASSVSLEPGSLEEALRQFNEGEAPAIPPVTSSASFKMDDAYIFNLDGEGLTTTSK